MDFISSDTIHRETLYLVSGIKGKESLNSKKLCHPIDFRVTYCCEYWDSLTNIKKCLILNG